MSKVIDATPTTPETAPVTPAPSFQERFSKWTPEERSNWELTGNEPAAPPAKEKEGTPAAPPAKEGQASEVPPQGDAPKTDSASDPEHQSTQEPPEDGRRLSRRDRRIRAQNLRIAELERQLASAPARGQSPAQQPAAGKPAPQTLTRPKMPRLDQYDTLDAYNKACDQYEVEMDAYQDAKLTAKQQEIQRQREEERDTREAEDEFVDVQASFHKRCAEFRKHPELGKTFDAAFNTVSTATQKAGAGWMDQFILDSKIGPAIIDHLAKNADAFKDLLELNPIRGIAALGRIEDQLLKAPVPKKIPSAPAPLDKLGGSGKVDGPPLGSQAWIDQENARDIARYKERGG